MTSNSISGFGKSTDNAFNLDVDHLTVNQGEDISGTATFYDNVIFNGELTFEGHVQINDDVDVEGTVTAKNFVATDATNQFIVQNAQEFDLKVATSTTPVFKFLDQNNSLSTSTIEANIINATTINNTKTISSESSNTLVKSSQKNTSVSSGAEAGYEAINSDNTKMGMYMKSTAGGKRGQIRSSSDAFGLDIKTDGYATGANKSIKLYTDHTTIDSDLSALKASTLYGATELLGETNVRNIINFHNPSSFLDTVTIDAVTNFEGFTNFNQDATFNVFATFNDQTTFNDRADFYDAVTMDESLIVYGDTETTTFKVNGITPSLSDITGAFTCNGGIGVARKSFFRPNYEIPAGVSVPTDSVLGGVVFENPIWLSVDAQNQPFFSATVYIKGPPALGPNISPTNQFLSYSLIVEATTQLDEVFITGGITMAGALVAAGLSTFNGASVFNGATTVNGAFTCLGAGTFSGGTFNVAVGAAVNIAAGAALNLTAGLGSSYTAGGGMLSCAGGALTLNAAGAINMNSATMTMNIAGATNLFCGAVLQVEALGTLGLSTGGLMNISAVGQIIASATSMSFLPTTLFSVLAGANISMGCLAGAVTMYTNSGLINLTATTGSVALTTGSGSVSLQAFAGVIGLSTGAGAMTFNTGAGAIAFTTASGAVSINAGAGSVSINTAAGAMSHTTGTGIMTFNTGAGAMQFGTGTGAMSFNVGAGGYTVNSGAGAMTYSTATGLMAFNTGAGAMQFATGTGAMAFNVGAGGFTVSSGAGAMTYSTGTGIMTFNTGAGGMQFATGTGAMSFNVGAGGFAVSSGAGAMTFSSGTGIMTFNTGAGAMQFGSGTGAITFNIGAGGFSATAGAGAMSHTTGTGLMSFTTGAGAMTFQAGTGGISFTVGGGAFAINTAAGALTLQTGAGILSLTTGTGGMNLTLGGGAFNLTTGGGVLNMTSGAGALNITSGAGALTVTCGVGGMAINMGSGALTMNLAAGALTMNCGAGGFLMNLGTGVGQINVGVGGLSILAGAGAIGLTTGAGIIALTVGVGAITLTSGVGAINVITAGGSVGIAAGFAGNVTVGTGSGNIDLQSGTGCINILANSGGINIGCIKEGVNEPVDYTKLTAHIVGRTHNGPTAAETGNITFTTHGTGDPNIIQGPCNFTVDTSSGRNGNIFFRSKGSFQVITDNGSETGGVYFNTTASNGPNQSWTWKFPSGPGTAGQVLTSQGSNINPYLATQTWSTVTKPDANGNVSVNNLFENFFEITNATSSPYIMTPASAPITNITRTGGAIIIDLPDATLLPLGATFYFNVQGTATVNVKRFGGGGPTVSLSTGTFVTFELTANTSGGSPDPLGTWDHHSLIPANTTWTTAEMTTSSKLTTTNTQVAIYTGLGIAASVWTAGGYGGQNAWLTQDLTLQNGTTGSSIAIKAPSTGFVSSYTMTLPISVGTAGQVLTSQGAATAMTWTTPTTGTVTSVGMTVPTFLSVSPSTITSSGTFAVTLSGTALPVLNGGTGTTTSTGSGSVVLSTTPTFTSGIVLAAATSGTITFIPPATVTSYSFIPPTTSGTVGQVLTSNAGGTMTWTTPSGGGSSNFTTVVTTTLAGTARSALFQGFIPSLATGNEAFIEFGVNTGTNNLGYIQFDYVGGSGSSANRLNLGLQNSLSLSLAPENGLSVFSTALQLRHTATNNGLYIFPTTANTEASILFGSQTTDTGARWVIGQNVAGGGSDTFGVYSTTLGSNLLLFIPNQAQFNVSVRALSLTLPGTTSGFVTVISPPSVSPSWSFILPTGPGSAGQLLTSSGGGTLTWTTPGAASSNFTTPVTTTMAGTATQIAFTGLVPSLATGNNVSVQFGDSQSTNDCGVVYFKNVGGAGSALNQLILGLYNNDYLTLENAQATFTRRLVYSNAGTASVTAITAIQTGLVDGNDVSIVFGKFGGASPNNHAYLSFFYAGLGSANNRLNFGLQNSQSLSLAPAGGQSTFSTSVRSLFQQVRPSTNNGEASTAYVQNTDYSGTYWVQGSGLSGLGSAYYGVYYSQIGFAMYMNGNENCKLFIRETLASISTTMYIIGSATSGCRIGLESGSYQSGGIYINSQYGSTYSALPANGRGSVNIGNDDLGNCLFVGSNQEKYLGRLSANGIINICATASNTQFMTFYDRENVPPFFRGPNAAIGSITKNGAGVSFNTTSDYRLKENVITMPSTLALINNLHPVTFTFLTDPTHTLFHGFIAHEVEQVFPEAVSGQKDAVDEYGNILPQSVSYASFTPMLTKAVQELFALIQQQQDTITNLTNRISLLENP